MSARWYVKRRPTMGPSLRNGSLYLGHVDGGVHWVSTKREAHAFGTKRAAMRAVRGLRELLGDVTLVVVRVGS